MTTAELQALFDSAFERAKVMVILRGFEVEQALALTRRAWALGLPLVEIPVQSEADLVALSRAAVEAEAAGRLVGAGTVTSVGLLQRVVAAGAAFTVAPGLDPEVLHASAELNVPHLPGVATATEVQRALALGARWQKAFPASVLGSGWLAAMRGPFPSVRLVATGGVDEANGPEFLRAGAGAVSLGSSFATASDEGIRALLEL